ncbi:alpha-tubulin [Naegleria gruberi]|uniref:Tubulin alpha chain n=1 Tax=Naegleria gruberi TaxID=5762 RepID=D2V982_NAEGR|nr:alpha-tubulin [Naegleria gruberi]EFC46543.1 alpha-tubulin [Naegleria gruberi]|eukprot:XP_002679287.1 alpha-tubulin [Naegleria gruberi]
MKEIITIHVGGAGCQIGDQLWELYCKEHGIQRAADHHTNNTTSMMESSAAFSSAESLFYETSHTEKQQYVPLAIFFDNDSSRVHESRKRFGNLMSSDNMIGGKEDAANNFVRGCYTIGKENMDTVLERIRILSEKCDSLQGINVVNSLGGGTGSGSGTLLLDRMSIDFAKVPIHLNTVAPSPKLYDTVVEPYNFCWAMEPMCEKGCTATFYDNEALYNVCGNHLGINDPKLADINQIIAHHISTSFSSCRIGSNCAMPVSFGDVNQTLVPIPNFELLTPSFVPFGSAQNELSMAERGKLAFSPSNTLISYNILEGKMLSSLLSYRGNVTMGDNFECLSAVKKMEGISMGPSWIPNTFSCHISKAPTTLLDDSVLGVVPSEKMLAVTTNTTAITKKLNQIMVNFDKMYEKRAFVHWYVGEGIEDEYFRYGRSILEEKVATYGELISQ